MFEGIDFSMYGMAGMVLIIAIAVVYKGTDLLKAVLVKKVEESKEETEERSKKSEGPGTKTLMLQTMKEQADKAEATLESRIERLEQLTEKELDEIHKLMEKKLETDEKQADAIAELKASVARIEGIMEGLRQK